MPHPSLSRLSARITRQILPDPAPNTKGDRLTFLLVGEESAGLQTLRMLLATPHRVAAVLTADASADRGATVGALARQSDVPTLPSELVRDAEFGQWMVENEIDILLNVHSLFVINGDIVAAPQIGSFNLHPGPLPRYAGLNVPSWAIYHGERTHGVTLHWMDAEIDSGAIAYSAGFELTDDDTGLSASIKCARHGLDLVTELVAAAESSRIPAIPQDLSERRYFGREPPQGGRIDWTRPAREVVNFVRAADYAPFPSPWGHPAGTVAGRSVGIAKATGTGRRAEEPPGTVAVDEGMDGVLVAAADEWVAVTRLEVDGRYAAAQETLAPGSRFETA